MGFWVQTKKNASFIFKMVYGQVAWKSVSNVAWNFVMLNNILTSLFHISPARDILHSHSSLCLCSSTPDKLSGDMTQLFGRHNSGFVRDDFPATWSVTFKMIPRLASSHFWKAPFVLNYTCNSPLYSCVKSTVAWGDYAEFFCGTERLYVVEYRRYRPRRLSLIPVTIETLGFLDEDDHEREIF